MLNAASKDGSQRTTPRWYTDGDEAGTEMSIGRQSQRGKDKSYTSDMCSPRSQPGGPTHTTLHPISPEDGKSITLTEFVKSYSGLLPAEIVVVEGANTSPVALCNEDILKVHRIKQQSMVLARANESKQYLIPFNAAIEFCVLYDPESNISKALKGYSFEKVSDLMQAEVSPKLVCARSSWEDKDTNRVAINSGEVLVVGRDVTSARKGVKKMIRMYSITKHTTKILPEDCIANFSTKPSLLPLYLAEIMEYIKHPFPCKALLHDKGLMVPPHFETLVRDQSGLVLNIVTMNKEMVLESTYNRDDIENPIIMDIPVELPQVKVKVVQFTPRGKLADHKRTEVKDIDAYMCQDEMEAEDHVEEEEEEGEGSNEGSIDDESFELVDKVENVSDSAIDRQHNIRPKLRAAPVSPRQFVEQYGHTLPAHVKIVKSCRTAETCLLVDEIYKVHFVTTTDGISMMDNTGYLVLVPTDSPTQFGVIFNPHADLETAVRGYTFESVQDVVGATQLPRVMCATQSYKSSSPASSVEEGEVLVVKRVELDLQSKAASVLTVYSIREGVTKKLQADCKGRFTTDPSRVQLHVSAILQHLPLILPMCAMMYLAGPGRDAISKPTVVMLFRYHPKSSLVATTILSLKRDWNSHQPVEIPLDASVKMTVIRTNARPISTTDNCRETSIPPEVLRWVKVANNGVQLPNNLMAERPNTTTAVITHAPQDAGNTGQPRRRPAFGTQSLKQYKPRRVPSLKERAYHPDEDSAVKTFPSSSDRYEVLSRSIADLTESLASLAARVACIEGKLGEFNEQGRGSKERGTARRNSVERQFVETLTRREVLQLLDAAGLGMYSEAFDREKIDGRLLCMLNDSVLQRDLNVTSELHRLKLLGIISGAVDVRGWLTHSARNATESTV